MTTLYNERCDVLATTAADGRDLLIDEYYEQLGADENLLM